METQEEQLKSHALTRRLLSLGVTEAQLEAIRFRANNKEFPFDQWSFSFPEDLPGDAINLVKPYCALKWLLLNDYPPSRDRDDAWRLVSDAMAAPVFEMALRYRGTQRLRARKPRGKIAGGEQSLNQLVEELAVKPEYLDCSAKELWRPFFARLDEEGLNPEENTSGEKPEKDYYEYDTGNHRKSITYGRFANVVSKCRSRKKSR